MACCHSLSILDNVIVGDPLEIKMFEQTNYKIEESNDFESLITNED